MTTIKHVAITAAVLTGVVGLTLFARRQGVPAEPTATSTVPAQAVDPQPAPPDDAGPVNIRPANAKTPRAGGGLGGLGYAEIAPERTWVEPTHRQSLMVSYPPSTIELIDSKPDPITGEWLSASYIAVAPFKVGQVATSQKDLLALAGRSARDETEFVLESWELVASPGHQPTSGGGTPPLFPAKHFRTTEIFRGALSGDVRGLEFDHEGRFIYVLLGDENTAQLLKFDNEPNASPQTVATSSVYPELVGMHHLEKFEHVSMGRQLDCTQLFPDFTVLVFVDTDNDGTFDGVPIFGSYKDLKELGVVGSEVRDSLRGPSY